MNKNAFNDELLAQKEWREEGIPWDRNKWLEVRDEELRELNNNISHAGILMTDFVRRSVGKDYPEIAELVELKVAGILERVETRFAELFDVLDQQKKA